MEMNTKTIDSLRNEIGADNLPILLGIFTSELEQYQAALTTETEQASQFQEICHSLKSSAASLALKIFVRWRRRSTTKSRMARIVTT